MVNLNDCKRGDKLLSKHGVILTYIGKLPHNNFYDHMIMYPNGSFGTRINDGHVCKNPNKRLFSDHDIVEILKE